MTILDRIVETKRGEVARLRTAAARLEEEAARADPPRDFAAALRGHGASVQVIAEVKRRSPGAGPIRPDLDPAELAGRYARAGAAALSVLTDEEYFAGSLHDLRAAREAGGLPVLRKDFVIDPIQVAEARAAGADAVLLIVRILDDETLARLHRIATDLGMGVLVEAHDRAEVERALAAGARILGINNRDLSTFETRLEVTLGLVDGLPSEVVLVSESGIRERGDVELLGRAGVDAVLVGESLLRHPDPGAAVAELAAVPRVGRGDA